jgi:hypothetical protein
MKRILIHSILSIALALLLQLFTPWWGVVLATAISSFIIRLKGGWVFFAPFLVIGLFWAAQAYLIAAANDFILAQKIAVLLPLDGSVSLLLVFTAVIGGLVAGLGSLSGRTLKVLVS